MTLKEITKANFSRLLRSMDPSIDLLGRLMSVPFLTTDRVPSVTPQVTDDHTNFTLLNALLEVPADIQQSVMNDFTSALRSSG